ncbi:M23 family metallopeptidase [Candidatus Uhrbacteria bacterium]|nr:M23 family metallopeptidase [Candidatus Uhrbacteria bacterium]
MKRSVGAFAPILLAVTACPEDAMVPPAQFQKTEEGPPIPLGNAGGGDIRVHLPFAYRNLRMCTQGAHGIFSHRGRTTEFGVDWDTDNYSKESVYAPVSGIAYVLFDGMEVGFGLHINIDLGNGVYIVIAHLSETTIRSGQWVEAGQFMGFEGNTGYSAGDHVHLGKMNGDASVSALRGMSVPFSITVMDSSGSEQQIPVESLQCGLPGGATYRSANRETQCHPDGTLVKMPGTNLEQAKVYRLNNGTRQWIASEQVFRTSGYDFDKVVVLSPDELLSYELGNRISEEGLTDMAVDAQGKLWLVVGASGSREKYRVRLPDREDLAWSIADSWGAAHRYSQSECPCADYPDNQRYLHDYGERGGMATYRDGTILKERNGPRIYVVSGGRFLHIRDMETYRILNYNEIGLDAQDGLPPKAVMEILDGFISAMGNVMVGDCDRGYLCLDRDIVTKPCGSELGTGGQSADPGTIVDPYGDSEEEQDGGIADAGAQEAQEVQGAQGDGGMDTGETADAGTAGADGGERDAGVASTGTNDAGAAQTGPHDAGTATNNGQTGTLSVTWIAPLNRTQASLLLSGEYVLSDGSWALTWQDLASATNAAQVSYTVPGAASGDILRFSVEFRFAAGASPSWSCIDRRTDPQLHQGENPLMPQGTVLAFWNGAPATVEYVFDPTGNPGCGVRVVVP